MKTEVNTTPKLPNIDKLLNSLKEVQKDRPESKVAIFMHDSPDPDAMGSALGLAWVIKKLTNLKSDIVYSGNVTHPENKALLNVMNLSFKTYNELKGEDDRPSYVIAVDGTPSNIKNDGLKFNAIIDHHRAKINEKSYDFVLNKQVGACSSLIYELIKEANLLDDMTLEDEVEATVLLLGIMTDTNSLLSSNVADLDFEAFAYFRNFANIQKINEIRSYPIPSYMFDYEVEASKKENSQSINGAMVCFIGAINPQRRDVLPYLSDRFSRKEGIDTTIIMAIVGEHLEASIRSRKVSLEVDAFVKKIWGDAYGGGKKGAGAAKVPLGLFSLEDDEEFKERVAKLTKEITFKKIENELTQGG